MGGILVAYALCFGLDFAEEQGGPRRHSAESDAPHPEAIEPDLGPSDVRRDQPTADDWSMVRCLLPVVVDHPGADLRVVVEGSSDEGSPLPTAATIDSGVLKFRAPRPEGAGLVALPGYHRAGLLWFIDRDGQVECTFTQDPIRRPHGSVRLPPLEEPRGDRLHYAICERTALVGADAVDLELPSGTCEAQVCVWSGPVSDCSAPFQLQVLPDQLVEVDPGPLPEGAFSRLGVTLSPAPTGGYDVLGVLPGSPGGVLGFAEGDRVVAIEGAPLSGAFAYPNLDDRCGPECDVDVIHPDGSTTTIPVHVGRP